MSRMCQTFTRESVNEILKPRGKAIRWRIKTRLLPNRILPSCHFRQRLVINHTIPIGVFWPQAGRTENRPIEPDAVRTDVGNSETAF